MLNRSYLINKKRVYVILLNWNGWKDTIECLESLFRQDYEQYRVIVCDNDSSDGSLEKIKAWAEGRLNVFVPSGSPLWHLSYPPVTKTIPYQEYDRKEAETGGSNHDTTCPLVLIQTGANLGFAGGNNVGIKYTLARNDFGYIWILNNDTTVMASTLVELVLKMQEQPKFGICGSTIYYYHNVNCIQALCGATYNKWLALPTNVSTDTKCFHEIDDIDIVSKIDYVHGTSFIVSRELIMTVGLLSEEYFLYFEELDYAIRSKNLFSFAYASKSVVYHKEGASIGTSAEVGKSSPLAEYYFNRNRIRFTKQYYPEALPSVILAILLTLLNRIRRRQPANFMSILKALFTLIEYKN